LLDTILSSIDLIDFFPAATPSLSILVEPGRLRIFWVPGEFLFGARRVPYYGKSTMDGKRLSVRLWMASLLVWVFFLLSASCGQEQGSPPILLNLKRYNSDCYLMGFDEGRTLVLGVVEFSDPDGDVLRLRLSTRACGEGTWSHIDTLMKDLTGISSGSLNYFASARSNVLPALSTTGWRCLYSMVRDNNRTY